MSNQCNYHQYSQESTRKWLIMLYFDATCVKMCRMCEFRMSVCMCELVPISNQLSFNISVLLGPPVGRAKLWVI